MGAHHLRGRVESPHDAPKRFRNRQFRQNRAFTWRIGATGTPECTEQTQLIWKEDSKSGSTAFTMLDECFQTRRNAYGIAEMIDPRDMDAYHTRILELYREIQLPGFRDPTVNEA